MQTLRFTRHAEARMRQRGFRNVDIALVLQVATRVSDDAYILRDKDAIREIERRRREIQQLERLRGTKLVVEGPAVVTIHHSDRKPIRSDSKRRRRKS